MIEQWKPSIVLLSETHVTADVELKELRIDRYKVVQCVTHNKRTGGVMALVREGLSWQIRTNRCTDEYVWMLSLRMTIDRVKYLVSVLYHPPNRENAKFVQYFDDFLDAASDFEGINIIVGDFNFDLLKPSHYSEKILRSTFLQGFTQLVSKPTRITDKSRTLIDYIITNNKYLRHRNHLSPKISDHNILSVNMGKVLHSDNYVTISKRDMNPYDSEVFQEHLMETSWDTNVSDVNVMAELLVNTLTQTLNYMCPEMKIVLKERYLEKKWITKDIRTMMRERDSLYVRAVSEGGEARWNQYKTVRNRVVSELRRSKELFFRQKLDDHKDNAHELWKNLKMLLPDKKADLPDKIIFQNVAVGDEQKIADTFNSFFITSIDTIVSQVPVIHDSHPCVQSARDGDSIVFGEFKQLSMSDLRKSVNDLKSVGGGKSGISTSVFKDAFRVLGNRMLDIINASLSNGTFPESWKTSTVLPVPKVSQTIQCEEFRPINTVPVYEKLLEMTVKKQLLDFCDKHQILVPNQSGFRQNHSCETAIVNICNDFVTEVDRGKYVLAVFLDFRRAFETIDRGFLLSKLEQLGLRNTVLKWFTSYLSDRTQIVKYKNAMSTVLAVNHGVPQGTILGPLLFLIYINDIVRVANVSRIELFADDTMLYVSGDNVDDLQRSLNRDLDLIYEWLCDNKLSVNVSKCKFCLFGKKSKLSTVNKSDLTVMINNNKIVGSKEIKYLGVILDSELKFHAHAEYCMRKFSRKIGFIARVGKHLSMYTKRILYNSLAAPHLEFCSTLLFNMPNFIIDEFQRIQNKGMRIIIGCNRYAPVSNMLACTNFLTVKQKIVFNSLVFIFKIRNRLLPGYVCDKTKTFSSVHGYDTRNKYDFIVSDRPNSNIVAGSLFYRGLLDFNDLPERIKSCTNLELFRRHLRAYIVDQVQVKNVQNV